MVNGTRAPFDNRIGFRCLLLQLCQLVRYTVHRMNNPFAIRQSLLLCLALFALYLAPQVLHRGNIALCYGLDYRSRNFLQPAPGETIPIVLDKIR